jgi:tetratricopeptide (TPR) repeat protein/transcriptional regulator with XRE-family HTH domain
MVYEGTEAPDGPLPTFCARLKRLQQASGLTQTALAGHAGLGKSQMSVILNGGIKQLPDWSVVQLVVRACLDHAAKTGKPLQAGFGDEKDWQRRYSDLEQDTEVAERPRRQEADLHDRPIGRWDPFTLGVHHPITTVWRSPSGPADLPELPSYVLREHDQRLRELLDPGQPSPRMVVLVGGSCTGKTRAAYEAVRSCLPEWRLVRPETSADLLHFLAGHMPGSETVLWLNETQAYLDGEHGEEAAAALRRLLASPQRIVVVGTMWGADWHALTARLPAGGPDHTQARELLDQSAIKIPVPACFTGQSLIDLHQAAWNDPRLAEAVCAASGTGEVAQVIAGGPWLVDYYRHEAGPYTKAVLDAAIDAWLLGHHAPLPAAMLEEAAAGYLDDRQRAVSAGWFDDALAQATAKIKGAVAPLTAVRTRHGAGAPDGYLLADYLLQHASTNRRPGLLPADLWDALSSHGARAEDHVRIAQSALKRNYRRHAALHFRSAVESSDIGDSLVRPEEVPMLGHGGHSRDHLVMSFTESFMVATSGDHSTPGPTVMPTAAIHGDPGPSARRGLAGLLGQAGQIDEAAELQRYLAERGDKSAAGELAGLLEQAGRIDEAVAEWQRLAASDEIADHPMRELAGMLARAGRIDEALEVSQDLADRGNNYAMEALAGLLEEAGKLDQAVAVWQRLAGRGDVYGMRMQAELLEQAERTHEAITVWKLAAEGGETYAMEALAGLLERAGRIDEAVAVWQPAVQGGDLYAMRELAGLLDRAGRTNEAIGLWQPTAERGDSFAMEATARLLERAGCVNEAMATWKRLVASDETSDYPMRELAGLLERVGRTDEAAVVWERADARGDPLARGALAELLERAGRIDEAVAVWQPVVQDGDFYAVRELAGLLDRARRTDEAAAVWERADARGDPLARGALAELLERAGRIDEAADVWHAAVQGGDLYAMHKLTGLLVRARRIDEAVAVWQPAAQSGDLSAIRMLAKLFGEAGSSSLAEWWLRSAVQHGDDESLVQLVGLLRMIGRADEAEQIMNFGLEPGGQTADPWA